MVISGAATLASCASSSSVVSRIDLDGRDCYFSTVTDVTHRRRAQELEEQFERFFTLSLDMLCIAHVDGSFRRLNPAFGELGYTPEELRVKPFIDLVHPDDVATTMAEKEKLSKGARSIRFENRYRCKDGSYRWLLWSTSSDASGTLYAAARDITERKRDEDANRRLTEKLIRSNRELEGGSSFSVVLPAAKPLPASVRAPKLTPESALIRGRVLVVDDDSKVAAGVKRVLEGEHDVVIATTGQAALDRLFSGEHFDVILCDLMMPEMTGMDFHEQLARVQPIDAQKVVFLSGGAFTSRARVFLESVPNERLEKPFDALTVRKLVRRRLAFR